MIERTGKPDAVTACVGGGSNAIGYFAFEDEMSCWGRGGWLWSGYDTTLRFLDRGTRYPAWSEDTSSPNQLVKSRLLLDRSWTGLSRGWPGTLLAAIHQACALRWCR